MSLDQPYEDEPFCPYGHVTPRFGVHIMCGIIAVIIEDPGHAPKEDGQVVGSYNPLLITWRR
jgi:hypothetical protein